MVKPTRFDGDSFVVDITPPFGEKEQHFPMVAVYRRKAVRKRGAVARGVKALTYGLPEPPSQRELAALAKMIGEAILNASPITKKWMKGTRRP